MALGKCRECGKEASTEAKACPHCGATRPVAKGIGLVRGALIALLAIGAVSWFASRNTTHNSTHSVPTTLPESAATDTALSKDLKVDFASPEMKDLALKPTTPNADRGTDVGRWTYTDVDDQMSGKKVKLAFIEANDRLNFDFPYSGGAKAELVLRKHPRSGTNVMLQVSKGQFICRSYDGCTVHVKFDDAAPIRFHASEPSDHDSTTLFLTPTAKLVDGIKKAKTTRIEAEFYKEGRRTIVFQTTNLKW